MKYLADILPFPKKGEEGRIYGENHPKQELSTEPCTPLDILPMLEEEARERQRKAGERGAEGGRGHRKGETLSTESCTGFDPPGTRIVGVNPRYVSDAKRIEQEAPEKGE